MCFYPDTSLVNVAVSAQERVL